MSLCLARSFLFSEKEATSMGENKIMNLEDIFGVIEERKPSQNLELVDIEIEKLIPFSNNPFKLYEGERLKDMVESIKEFGVIVPIIVKPEPNGLYEILAGHNRCNAAKIAGLHKIPAIIKLDLTEDEAIFIVTETNFIQRSFEDLSYSEKVAVISERYKVIKTQGKRNDLINEIKMLSKVDGEKDKQTSCPLGTKLRSDSKVGHEYNLSRNMVARYIRLSQLNKDLLIRVDNGEIAFMTAVILSFISSEEQEIIENILSNYDLKVDMKKAEMMKGFSGDKKLTEDTIKSILSGEAQKKRKSKDTLFTLNPAIVKKYFPQNTKEAIIQEVIQKALELYFFNNPKKTE